MVGRKLIRTGLVLVLALAAAGIFAMVGRADDPRFDPPESSLQPSFVKAGGDVLYKAKWHYIDNRTLSHAEVQITIQPGWQLIASAPSGCTQSGTLVTCDWGTLHFDDVVAQAVRLRTDADTGLLPVTSLLTFFEGPGNPGRQNRVEAPIQKTDVFSTTDFPDKAGDCVSGNFSVQTTIGSGNSETVATAPSTGELCTPITIVERGRQNPTESCLEGLECETDIVTTNAAPVLTTDPIKLKITFRGTGLGNNPLIFTSSIGQFEVQECTDPHEASPDPCWYGHNARQQSVTWQVNWSGVDPEWTG